AHYRRTTLWVEPLGRQARQAALVYLGQPKWTVEEGRPEPGYLQLLVRGATYHGLPADYVEWLGGSLGC
ncbi:MAG: gamma-glutamylcyclotransferase, partial [Gemmatimonadota bacterium]